MIADSAVTGDILRLSAERSPQRAAIVFDDESVSYAELDRRAPVLAEAQRLARRFKVSTLVVLRRVHDAGGLSKKAFWRAYQAELQRLLALPKSSGGGDFYATPGARAGKTFARALVTSALEGRTSFTEAFRLLGFKKMATFKGLGKNLGVVF